MVRMDEKKLKEQIFDKIWHTQYVKQIKEDVEKTGIKDYDCLDRDRRFMILQEKLRKQK